MIGNNSTNGDNENSNMNDDNHTRRDKDGEEVSIDNNNSTVGKANNDEKTKDPNHSSTYGDEKVIPGTGTQMLKSILGTQDKEHPHTHTATPLAQQTDVIVISADDDVIIIDDTSSSVYQPQATTLRES